MGFGDIYFYVLLSHFAHLSILICVWKSFIEYFHYSLLRRLLIGLYCTACLKWSADWLYYYLPTQVREFSTITVWEGGGVKYFGELGWGSTNIFEDGPQKPFELFYLKYECQYYGMSA